MMDDELFFGEKVYATADQAGVYRFVKAFWSEEDVGHLFYVYEGAHFVNSLTGADPFAWNPDLLEEGHIVKIPQSEQLMPYIKERDHMQEQLDTMLRSLGPHGRVSDEIPR